MPRSIEPRTDIIARLFSDISKQIAGMEECPERPEMWPMVIQMACGVEYTFKGPDDFPLDTLRCICDDPGHIVVLWE
ncbi:MAG: hypothetical protein GTN93_10440, partial [Anaerolineae bacterium]|nr:hypothetical protein [Anaerolineae bacterium]